MHRNDLPRSKHGTKLRTHIFDGCARLQVDFLEKNTEYSACVHSGYLAYEDGTIKRRMFRSFRTNQDVSTEEIIERWLFPTASIIYRRQ